jgi:uncharacterized protein (DUF39 family)
MNNQLRKLVEDRLYIKATHVLRRKITTKELSTFFIHNTHPVDKLYQQFINELDNIIKTYLEAKK